MAHSVAVFDLGGVVIDWNARYLYRKLFNGNETGMECFLAAVCTSSWNAQQDAGRSFADGCDSLKRLHPGQAELIDAWFRRYDEMLRISAPLPRTLSPRCQILPSIIDIRIFFGVGLVASKGGSILPSG
jgi:2-haloacid dehalogenase